MRQVDANVIQSVIAMSGLAKLATPQDMANVALFLASDEAALVSGVIMTVDGLSSALGVIRGGNIRALVVASAKRSAALPDLPTAAEAGLPGFEWQTYLYNLSAHALVAFSGYCLFGGWKLLAEPGPRTAADALPGDDEVGNALLSGSGKLASPRLTVTPSTESWNSTVSSPTAPSIRSPPPPP